MDDAFAREVTIRSLLKSKWYEFDQENQWGGIEWTTNRRQERDLEVAAKTDDEEWGKLMMTHDEFVFSAETIKEGIDWFSSQHLSIGRS